MYDCTCERCKYNWVTDQLPKSCSKCKSKYWNKLRTQNNTKMNHSQQIYSKVQQGSPADRGLRNSLFNYPVDSYNNPKARYKWQIQ